ncbi:MAG: hypothetical protein MK132_23880 [Lentisphaerales bacterium]|nr:hypothetical protein [Lentisphaerales bacterium]
MIEKIFIAIVDAFQAVLVWFFDLVLTVVLALFPSLEQVDIDWSPLADSLSFANAFFPVTEFFIFLIAYLTLKAAIWPVKLVIQLL